MTLLELKKNTIEITKNLCIFSLWGASLANPLN